MSPHAEIIRQIDPRELLRQAGIKYRTFGTAAIALCPFHSEKTGSFRFEFKGRFKGKFHCHGCDQKGDIFDFAETQLGISKRDAVLHLAAVAGVTVDDRKETTQERRKRLQDARDREMVDWWAGKQRNLLRGQMDKAIRELNWMEVPRYSWVKTCSRLFLWFEGLPREERLELFRKQITMKERKEFMARQDYERRFAAAWIRLAQ